MIFDKKTLLSIALLGLTSTVNVAQAAGPDDTYSGTYNVSCSDTPSNSAYWLSSTHVSSSNGYTSFYKIREFELNIPGMVSVTTEDIQDLLEFPAECVDGVLQPDTEAVKNVSVNLANFCEDRLIFAVETMQSWGWGVGFGPHADELDVLDTIENHEGANGINDFCETVSQQIIDQSFTQPLSQLSPNLISEFNVDWEGTKWGAGWWHQSAWGDQNVTYENGEESVLRRSLKWIGNKRSYFYAQSIPTIIPNCTPVFEDMDVQKYVPTAEGTKVYGKAVKRARFECLMPLPYDPTTIGSFRYHFHLQHEYDGIRISN